MTGPSALEAALAGVVAIHDDDDHVCGTGITVSMHVILTALHVVAPAPTGELHVTDRAGTTHPVTKVVSLPTWSLGPGRSIAKRSYHRARDLTGEDSGTVDLALLQVPGLSTPTVAVRENPVTAGERLAVGGYPSGHWTVSLGPVTSTDDADFAAHVLLGPGASGAAAIDSAGRLTGLLTMDHPAAGSILIGPTIITAFLDRALPLTLSRKAQSRRNRAATTESGRKVAENP